MSAKLKTTTRYLLLEQLRYLGFIGIFFLVSTLGSQLISAIVAGKFSWQTFLSSFTVNIGFLFGLFILVFMMLTYDNFKLLIQNGISRKTYWRARVLSIISLSLIGDLIAAAYYYLVTTPIEHRSLTTGFSHQAYAQLYGSFFGNHNLAGNLIGNLFFMWAVFIMLGLSGMAIGSIFSLFTKTVRRLVLITIPILGGFFLVFLINVFTRFPININLEGFAKFLGFLAGYTNQSKAGALNPITPMLTMLVLALLMAAIAYYFNRKLKIKNG